MHNYIFVESSITHLKLPNQVNFTSEIVQKQNEKSVTSKIHELAQFNDIKYTYTLLAEEVKKLL